MAGGNNNRMGELSRKRAIPAMPVGGSFRCIDFVLSNMSNSHVQTVAVLTQYNSRSLNEHLSSSKWWDFGRKQGGLYLFTPTVTAENSDWYRGTADASYPAVTVCIRWITMTCWSFISQRKQILPLRARICRRMRMSAVSESSV